MNGTTEMKHTPGPWAMTRSIQPHDGEYDCAISAEGAPVLAEAFGMSSKGLPLPAQANARLIAAAPDLLEALENAAGFMDTPISRRRNAGDSFYEETVRAIRAAIAKAEGQS